MLWVILFSLFVIVLASDVDLSGKRYNLMEKLVYLEQKSTQQDRKISHLTEKLEEAENKITKLSDSLISSKKYVDGSTYIRWGRTTCPRKAVLVYNGFAAGSHYTHSGSGSNPLCLPKDPDYAKYTTGFQSAARIYGAEYQTHDYPNWSYLHDHDVPCAVCRIPRNDVIMVPGKTHCHENYVLEYKGYLMAEYFGHSSSEYVCVDENPETVTGTHANRDGKLFYFVEGVCGSLRCDPYKNGWELTCAVCSYSYKPRSKSIQPYS